MTEDEGIDPAANIHRVAEKKWRSLSKLEEATARRRLYAFLARRGFNPDEISIALGRLPGANVRLLDKRQRYS